MKEDDRLKDLSIPQMIRVMEFLDGEETVTAIRPKRRRWVLPAAASFAALLLATGAVVWYDTPRDTFSSPEQAYRQVEMTLDGISSIMAGSVSGPLQSEQDACRKAFTIFEKTIQQK